MDDHQAFGRWLKRRRAELNMTQAAVAVNAGCALQTVRAFEIGRRRPSRLMAERLAEVLKIPADEREGFIRIATVDEGRQPGGGARHDAGGVAQAAPTTSLIMTKLYRPHVPVGVVERPRLSEKMHGALAGPLTLVAAPAGFGKTMLVAQQLATLGHPHAWLSLDGDDNDPATFVQYFMLAVQSVTAVVRPTTRTLIQAGVVRPEIAIRALINDLGTLPQDVVVALDDYHLITNPAIHTAMVLLLEHMPPQLHLVILTRADPPFPLAKWRVRRQVVEIRAADLRFTVEEATTFLQGQTGLALTAADMAVLEQRTEGWIAGLHLASLSLQQYGATGASSFVAAFSGSNRFVVDYLLDEVLAQLPAHIQTFVLSTSILERFCAPLCDGVLGLTSHEPAAGRDERAYSQLILAELERLNLFLIPLDDQRRWYRYHHLFAEVVNQRLVSGASAADVMALHERASTWFEGQGLVQEAVHHAIRAAMWPRVVRFIEQHGLVLMQHGHVHMVLAWLQTLPAPLLETHPFLQVVYGAGLLFTNQLAAAEARLQHVEHVVPLDAGDNRSLLVHGTARLVRANLARFRGDLARFVTLANEALAVLPPAARLQRAVARLNLTSAYLVSGDVTATTERAFVAALATLGETGGVSAVLRGQVALAGLQRLQGRLRQAEATYRAAADMLGDRGVVAALVDSAAYYVGLGDLLRERNNLDAAEQCLTEGRNLALGTLITSADMVALGYIALARVTAARGDWDGADALLDELLHEAHERSFADDVAVRANAARAQLALLRGDLDAAGTWAVASGLQPDDEAVFLREYEYLTLARVYIAAGCRDPGSARIHAAVRLIKRWHDAATAAERWSTVIETLVLWGLALAALGDEHAAVHMLERAIARATPEGYIRVFVDEGEPLLALLQKVNPAGTGTAAYCAKLLAVFRASPPGRTGHAGPDVLAVAHATAAPASLAVIEPLTERELDVLRLLASGASNQAIADQLVISLATAKKHVNNIFGKLHAQNRTEAVARAREARVLP